MDEDLTDSGADTFDPIYTPELETLTTPPQDSDIPVIDQFGAVDTTPEADPIYTPELETLTTPPLDSDIPVIDDFGTVDTTPEADPIYTPELETLTTPPEDSDIPVIDQFGAVDTTPEADPIYTPELETLTTPPLDSDIPVIDDFGAVDTTPETRVGLEQSGTVEPILEQGVFDTSFQGTCGICTVANVLNTIVGEGRYSEGSVLEPAIREGLCTVDSIPENNGGTSVDDRAALYELMEPDAVNVDVHEGSTALTPAEIAKELERGNAVEIFVSSDELWDTKSLPGRMFDFGLGRPPKYDHAIQVVAPVTNDIGEITSWTVADSGGGVQQVSARKFDLMYWGRKSTPPDNCASIVVSRK